MPSTFTSIAAFVGLISVAQSACTETGGNWYCNAVSAVTYDNFGGSGSYNRVTLMDDSTGACNFTTQSYSGSNAPFDQELSLHLRGPIQLKQFAFYTPTSSSSKVKRDNHLHQHRHAVHARHAAPEAESRAQEDNVAKRDIVSRPHTDVKTVSCPSSNGTTYTYKGESYIIQCGLDMAGNIDFLYAANFASCIQACEGNAACVDVSYVASGGGCYMKNALSSPVYNDGIWNARLASASSSSASVSLGSATSFTTSTSSTVGKTATSSIATSSSLNSVETTSTSSISTKTSSTLMTSTISKLSTSTLTSTSSELSTSTISSSTSSSSSSSAAPLPTSTGTSWTQRSYYSSTSQSLTNLVFLNSMGGGSSSSDSGVWSSYFGSSLSYASSSGTAAAGSPQTLADTTINNEIILFSGETCSGEDGDCGYYRPGSVAHHGFGGAQKVFLLEFAMPTGANGSDAPAIWLLNALIPRTQEYGSCTCWGNTNGCGEIDIFEVLTSGLGMMTSSIHGNQAGGDSDYFTRPTSGTIKTAIVLDQGKLTISLLPAEFTFDSVLEPTAMTTVMELVGDVDSVVTLA